MKILHCDSCHVEVNDYAHWYNDAQPRNMYELKCVHESGSDTYNGMIICHKCIAKLLHKAESEEINETVTEFADRCRECGAKYGKLLKQKSGKWIPVSERLPEIGSEVLVCFDFKGKRNVYISHFYGDGEFHGLDDEYLTTEGRKYRKAVAWMPLPQPYKSEGE